MKEKPNANGYQPNRAGIVKNVLSGFQVQRYTPAMFSSLRLVLTGVLVIAMAAGCDALLAQMVQGKIVFSSKMGDVSFDHTAHVKRVNNDCSVCQDKLFPKSGAPINYKAAVHKTAETANASCGGCHDPGGAAFETKGNCGKCHMKS